MAPRTSRSTVRENGGDDTKKQLEIINTKLEKIIGLLQK
jgi:hypothetical protein